METGNVFSCEPKGDGGKLCGQVGTRVRAHGFSTILKFDKVTLGLQSVLQVVVDILICRQMQRGSILI